MLLLDRYIASGANAVRAEIRVAILMTCFGIGPTLASARCDVPLVDWQPREALQKKLEAEGWRVISIRADDGCYKVRAANGRGERLEGKFDPAKLRPVQHENDGGDD